jgi:hypothetical protein
MENISKALEEIIAAEKENISKEELIDRVCEKQREAWEKMDKDELFLIYVNLITKG